METQTVSGPGSGPIYEMQVDKDVFAKMRDGTRLAVDLYRPAAEGRFPALLSMHPYSKDTEALVPFGKELGCFNVEFSTVEAGDHEFWAQRGYVHAIADVRGTGKSEGEYRGLFSPDEQQDGYDLVEWVAAQPWCDGNVGMIGISYLAIIQYLVAAQQPPHLKAIAPHDGWGDLYRDIMYQGGILGVFWWVLDLVVATSRGLPATVEHAHERVQALLDDPATSLGKCPATYKVLTLPDVHPVAFDVVANPLDCEYYRERSPLEHLEKIRIPTYLGSEMHQAYTVSMHLPGATWGWESIDAPKKLKFPPYKQGGLDRPYHEHHDELLRWFDHWLRGIDTGIMDEPPVKVWVRGREDWRYANEWPLHSETRWTPLYLREGGMLSPEAPTTDESPDHLDYEPAFPVIRGGVPLGPQPSCLAYATGPFDEDIELIGPIVLNLNATLSSEDGHFIVTLKEVAADGSELVISRGWLRAAHRELDPARSRPWKPFHPHDRDVPVTPGEVDEFPIEIQPIAALFRKGMGLKLEVWPCDWPVEPYYDWTLTWGVQHHIPYGEAVSYEIFHTASRPSHLLVPVMGS